MNKKIRAELETMGATETETNLDSIANDATQVGMGVLMILAALMGVWGVACLIGGIANSDGVLGLVRGFITAVTGM